MCVFCFQQAALRVFAVSDCLQFYRWH